MKYLGIIFDKILNFNQYLRHFTDTCIRKINKLSAIARNTWGLRSDALSPLYFCDRAYCTLLRTDLGKNAK